MRIFPLNQEPLYYLVQETLLQDSLKVNPFSVRKKEGERKKKKAFLLGKCCFIFLNSLIFPPFGIFFFFSFSNFLSLLAENCLAERINGFLQSINLPSK